MNPITQLTNAPGLNLDINQLASLHSHLHSHSHLVHSQHSIKLQDNFKARLSPKQVTYIQRLTNKYVKRGLKLLHAIEQVGKQTSKMEQQTKDITNSNSGDTDEDPSQQMKIGPKLKCEQSQSLNQNSESQKPQNDPNKGKVPLMVSKWKMYAQSFGRKKKAALTQEQIQNLQLDLKSPNVNKQQIQKKYDISESTLNRYVRRFRQWEEQVQREMMEQQSIQPLPPKDGICSSTVLTAVQGRERRTSKVRLVEQKVIQIYKKYPNIYQSQVAELLTQQFKMEISTHVVSRCLKNINARQKTESLEQNDLKNIQHRFLFAKEFLKRNLTNYIFIDQAFIKNKGLQNQKKQMYWDKVHFAIALTNQGRIVHSIIQKDVFKVHQIVQLLNHISQRIQKFTIVLDTARIHTDQKIKQFTQQNDLSLLYIPNSSPHLNPIQAIFSSFIKQLRMRVKETDSVQQVLRKANQSMQEYKQRKFQREVQAARKYVDMSAQRQPLPFPTP